MAIRRAARNAALMKVNAPSGRQDAPSDASPVEPAEVAAQTVASANAKQRGTMTVPRSEAFNSKRSKFHKLKKGSLQQVAQTPIDAVFEVSLPIAVLRLGLQLTSVEDLQQAQSH